MKKIFTLLSAIMLMASMAMQAQQVQRISRTSQPKISSMVKHSMNAVQRAESSVAPVQNAGSVEVKARRNAPDVKVSPRRNTFPSYDTPCFPMEEDDGQEFSLSETTVTQNNYHEFLVTGETTIQVQQSWGMDYGTAKSELYLYTDGTTSYLPSGLYNIETSRNAWTGGATTSTSAILTYGGYVYWYNNNYGNVFFLWLIDGGSVYVVNPDHSSKPNYIGLVGTELDGGGSTWWSKFGSEPDKHTVTFTWGNNGTDDGNDFNTDIEEPIMGSSGNTYTVYQTSVFTLTPQPKPGWRFVQWTGTNVNDITSNGDGTYRLSVGAKDYTVAAVFEEASGGAITGVASPAAGGSVTVSPTGTQPAGTAVTLTPVVNSGYIFTGWADGGDDNPRIVYVEDDRTYTANFALARTITVGVDNVSHGTATGSGTYADGASVQISASGLNGYQFTEWDDGNSENPRTITVSSSKTTYTASFTLTTMSVANCSDASISFHCDYGDVLQAEENTYYYNYAANNVANVIAFAAKNSDNYGFQLWFARNDDYLSGTYDGGECDNQYGPYPGTYDLRLAQRRKVGYSTLWRCYTGNTIVCYQDQAAPNYPVNYSYIKDGSTGNTINIRRGSITVSENNEGGVFIETSGCSNWSNENQTIYFTFGNRNEYTVNLGTGTMSVTPSSLTMSATNGSNFASITLNNNTTGAKTLTDFDVNNSVFVYNGTPLSEISDITGTVSSSVVGGVITYTMNLKIRDCQQNLYKVSMSAVAPSFSLGWNANNKSITGGTTAGSVQFGASITAPTSNTTGYHISSWTPAFTGTMPAQDVIYTANWATITYNLTYEGLNGASNSNPETYTVETATITLANPGTRTGYDFTGWTCGGDAITQITLGSTGDKTITANWSTNTYNLTYEGLNGATNSNPATYNVETATFALANPGTRTGYTFTGWTCGGNAITQITLGSTGDKTITANWTANQYAITYKDQNDAAFSGTQTDAPTTHTYGTATTLKMPTREGYNFGGWFTVSDCQSGAIGNTTSASLGATDYTDDITLYAKWELAATYSSVTFTAGDHGSVAGSIGGAAITSGQTQVDGSSVTLTATAAEFYRFVKWQNESGEQVSTNAEYTFTLSSAVNLTAVFALQETIVLRDNFENGSQWQTDYADLLTTLTELSDDGKVAKKDVRLNRTFAANRWSTFALPFNYSLQNNTTHPFYGHVYSLVSAQYEEKDDKGYLTLNCMPNTTGIYANTPYILITGAAGIENPVFNDVRLTEIEENTTTVVQDVNNTGSVRFVNTEYRQRIDKIEQKGVDSKENKSVIYLSGNKLYYPGGAIYQNAFRAYFVMNYEDIYHVTPRVRLVMPNGESVEQAEEETVETKKYIENGILVIERNGIKYDAQGHVIK